MNLDQMTKPDQMMTSTAAKSDLERKVVSLERQLIDAQRRSALGELVSTTTHEFNNVLMTIINYAKMGLRHRDEQTRDKALKKIVEAGERAAQITNTILGMARNRADRLEPVDLTTLLEDTLVLLEREMKKYRVRVTKRLDRTPPTLANANQIQQVLLNLLINARQAMPKGGEVSVELRHDPHSNLNELTVRDTGCGIPADKLRHIFEPFFTTKSGPDSSGRGGTGLGLSACRSIIEAHRGRIRVESTVGRGTAFTVKLRTADAAEAAIPVAVPHSSSRPAPTPTPTTG
jgi:signal transduction histidine kinase